MRRTLHSLPGLILSLLIVVLALSGAALSLAPALDRLGAPSAEAGMTVADLAERVTAAIPGTEVIRRTPNGRVIVSYFDGGPVDVVVDPATGEAVAPHDPPVAFAWLEGLHRSFLTRDSLPGRIAAGLGALGLLALLATGAALLHSRIGTWTHFRDRVKGSRAQRLHIIGARLALPGLAVAAVTGALLSLASLGLVPGSDHARAPFPDTVDGGTPAPVGTLAALQAVPLAELRLLVFPFDGDPREPFELTTTRGAGFVDQATGDRLTWEPHSDRRRLLDRVAMLHGGQGLWWFGLALGLSALSVPLLASSGTTIWWQRRRARPRIRRNVALADADTVILVGSEGNTTWGFALTLQDALSGAGAFVHVTEMDAISPAHAGDRRMFILTATYGDGTAPASAHRFLERLERVPAPPARGVTVLGFGDRDFEAYCAFAHEVAAALQARGWEFLAPLDTVNRQSPQEFARWGEDVGAVLGIDLRLVHIVEAPRGQPFVLISREDYGEEIGAPSAILRFCLPPGERRTLWQQLTGASAMPRFDAGDLMGVVPPGSTMPRYYSLGSGAEDGFLEIAVRRHEHGKCSRYLHGLRPGDRIHAFVRPNPEFHLQPGKAPVILVGTGCGIGPLAGFIRANRTRRPIRLYFGARDPDSDFLYRDQIRDWIAEGRLSAVVTAFSRGEDPARLPRRIAEDAGTLREMVAGGARIMVVGSREMARDTMRAIDRALAPDAVTVDGLRKAGRYVEDIF